MPDPLTIERVPLASLSESPWNAMKHPEPNLQGIRDSLQQFGQVEPLCVRRATSEVIGGNGRLAVMRTMGWQECDAVFLDVDEPTAKALSLALNRTAQTAEWDMDKVSAMLRELEKTPLEIDKLGWDEKEVAALLLPQGGEVVDAEPQIDRAAELQKQWGTKSGDLWLVPSKTVPGKLHRVLCGDSTKAEDVARVMGGEKAGLLATDPPYGVAYKHDDRPCERPHKFNKIANDTQEGVAFQTWLETGIKAWLPYVNERSAWYLWHAQKTQGYFTAAAAAAAADIIYHRQIVWVKPHFTFGRGHYHWRHELCLMGWRKGYEPEWCSGDRNETTVWQDDYDGKKVAGTGTLHPNQKPLSVILRPIKNHSTVGQIVLDPFLGSGSTLIAAEQLGRLAYGIEISAAYTSVVLERCKVLGLCPRLA